MSSDVAIKISDISKYYQIYDKPLDRLKQSVFRGRKKFYKEFKALHNVSFEVKKGETVGIVGRNGSGKSTLLQMICGTLTPTFGSISLTGRVAALLELGAGFNPEFTGRENVLMNATILGLSAEEINEKYDEIVDFSELGAFIEQPVKTYSSGMYVRLAFSVAINVDPEILIIDEALAVGDEMFQQKCYAKINSLREKGTTVLFVSHSASAIVELCSRAVLLDQGESVYEGEPKIAIALYHKLINAVDEAKVKIRNEIIARGEELLFISDQTENEGCVEKDKSIRLTPFYDSEFISKNAIEYVINSVEITNPMIKTLNNVHVNNLVHGEEYIYSYDVRFFDTVRRAQYGMLIKTVTGLEIGGAIYPSVSKYITEVAEGKNVSVSFQFKCLLNPAVYFMNAGIQGENGNTFGYLHRLIDTLVFRVLSDTGLESTGIVDFDFVSNVAEK